MAKRIAELPNDTVIDGEIVAFDEQGRPSFNLLQGFGNAQETATWALSIIKQIADFTKQQGCPPGKPMGKCAGSKYLFDRYAAV